MNYLKNVDSYHYNELKHIKLQSKPAKSHKHPKRGKPKRLTFISKVHEVNILSNERDGLVKKFDKNAKHEKDKALLINDYLENNEVKKKLKKRTTRRRL